ncbi:MAG: YARHG domain-containing protein [Ancylobacter novellus]|uniref:YARHG domain-containing protein n=1 Tax=Ancylobacter novellus TaxID=921 RepID=A0A2W5KHZ1_ANCNO|nr:MAG: YARHG domain-containing protein [Ancylobacter novellus]
MKLIAILVLVISTFSGPAIAQDRCARLWFERNAVYKDAGYCFKTSRAISAFGNAGCSFDAIEDVPLSARQREYVARIQAEERNFHCPR